MCRFFEVSRSGYDAFVRRLGIAENDAALAEMIAGSVSKPYKRGTLEKANEMIDRFICFYNHERIQLKTGVAPLSLRHSA